MGRSRIGVIAALGGAGIVTIATGTPAALPDIALSSSVLFHLERIVVLLASAVAILLVVSRAWRGELPFEISAQGLKYSDTGLDAVRQEAMRARADRNALAKRLEAVERQAYREQDE
jgi:hypothetical protein